MELGSNREERFVSKLIQDTKKGELKWVDQPNDDLPLPSSERLISKIYITKINGKNFRIYEFQIKHYKEEDEWDWIDRIKLELIDDKGAILFEFGYDYSLFKLFNAVRKLNSGIDELMKDFLNE